MAWKCSSLPHRGRGPDRIETLVFLATCPTPSSFLPAIRHLTARPHDTGTEIHFITDHVARAEVIATGIAGEIDRASLDVAMRDDSDSPSLTTAADWEVAIPVEIVDSASAGRAASGMPVTFGVPLPRGKLPRALTSKLKAGGVRTTAQCRVHSLWPDGSARWVLVDAVLPKALPQKGRIG